MFIGYLFGGLFVFGMAALLSCMIYDDMRCNHEWEEHGIKVYCEHRHCTVDAYCLICKKCGKVKVIK